MAETTRDLVVRLLSETLPHRGPMTAREIAAHPRVARSHESVRKALYSLEREGTVVGSRLPPDGTDGAPQVAYVRAEAAR